ncbi:MAG: 50S ribosomal protein L2 [Nanoarchaeota archaeon]|nr:50S ribosomal protein L2 [Nanoarchaeota archaeon]
MGKRIISQRRGRGTTTYRAHSHRWNIKVKHRPYDKTEREGSVSGIITNLTHCKGHSAPIAIIKYENNEYNYVFAPVGVKVGDKVESGSKAAATLGSTLPLANIPEGTIISNIESNLADGGAHVRASGATARLLTKSEKGVMVEMPSKKKKLFNPLCRATIGKIAGAGKREKPMVKAGKRYHMMKARGKLYPRTSGVAMNAVDHPFGSGRGRHAGKPLTAPRFAPPGRNVGKIRARRTGKKR